MKRNILVSTDKVASLYDKRFRRNRVMKDFSPEQKEKFLDKGYAVTEGVNDHPKSANFDYFAQSYSKMIKGATEDDVPGISRNLAEMNDLFKIKQMTPSGFIVESKPIKYGRTTGQWDFYINPAKPLSVGCKPVGQAVYHGHIYHSTRRHPTMESFCYASESAGAVSRTIETNKDFVEHLNVIHSILDKNYSAAYPIIRCDICDDIIKGKIKREKDEELCDECR